MLGKIHIPLWSGDSSPKNRRTNHHAQIQDSRDHCTGFIMIAYIIQSLSFCSLVKSRLLPLINIIRKILTLYGAKDIGGSHHLRQQKVGIFLQ